MGKSNYISIELSESWFIAERPVFNDK